MAQAMWQSRGEYTTHIMDSSMGGDTGSTEPLHLLRVQMSGNEWSFGTGPHPPPASSASGSAALLLPWRAYAATAIDLVLHIPSLEQCGAWEGDHGFLNHKLPLGLLQGQCSDALLLMQGSW